MFTEYIFFLVFFRFWQLLISDAVLPRSWCNLVLFLQFTSPINCLGWSGTVETCGDELYSPVSQRVSKSSEMFIIGDLTFIFLLFTLWMRYPDQSWTQLSIQVPNCIHLNVGWSSVWLYMPHTWECVKFPYICIMVGCS